MVFYTHTLSLASLFSAPPCVNQTLRALVHLCNFIHWLFFFGNIGKRKVSCFYKIMIYCLEFEAFFFLIYFFYTKLSHFCLFVSHVMCFSTSATRFGKILPLWQHFKYFGYLVFGKIWTYFRSIFVLLGKFSSLYVNMLIIKHVI